jgi:glutamyl-tRNA reductase
MSNIGQRDISNETSSVGRSATITKGGCAVKIGVVGAGSMGGILARHLAKLRHHVSIANSRGPDSLAALAAERCATPVSVTNKALQPTCRFAALG